MAMSPPSSEMLCSQPWEPQPSRSRKQPSTFETTFRMAQRCGKGFVRRWFIYEITLPKLKKPLKIGRHPKGKSHSKHQFFRGEHVGFRECNGLHLWCVQWYVKETLSIFIGHVSWFTLCRCIYKYKYENDAFLGWQQSGNTRVDSCW